jgi:hypothetical protein
MLQIHSQVRNSGTKASAPYVLLYDPKFET